MKKSNLFTLQVRDFIKGLILSVLTVVCTSVYKLIQEGHFPEDGDWKKIGLAATSAFIAYLLKNLFTNSSDQFAKSEKSKP